MTEKEERTKEIRREVYNTLFKILGFIILAIIVLFFCRFIWIGSIDSYLDIKSCKIGYSVLIGDEAADFDRCYANEDYFKFNNMHDISCTCFYYGNYEYLGKGLKSKIFKIK